MHLIFFILSLVFLWQIKTTASSLGQQLVAPNDVIISKCIDKERQALLDFKAQLQDPNGRLSTWRPEEDCCKWEGVECNNQTGHITKLTSSYYPGDLKGKISPSLLNLSYLSSLDLPYNSLHGIPTFICSMTRLTYLNLAANYFNGTIPRCIGFLTQLRYLNLGMNYIHGTIPKSIGYLTELRYLDLSFNYLHGNIPPEFGNLTNLQILDAGGLGRCRIENIDWLSRLSHLHSLYMGGVSFAKANNWVNIILSLQELSVLSLWGCDLSKVMYPFSSSSANSSSLSSIVDLSIRDNNLNSSMYHWLFPLTGNKLEFLQLGDNMLDGIPKYIGNLCSLKSLQFSDNYAFVKFPEFLNNLSGCTSASLQVLEAINSHLIGSLSDEIQNFSSLNSLCLFDNQLSGIISEKVWELPKLSSLHASSNYLRGAISKNIGNSNLVEVDLSNNLLEGVSTKAHMSNLSYVRSIDMNSCKLGPMFPNWILRLKNLTHLNIANTSILDTIPLDFWNTWPSQLTYLNLSSNNISGIPPDLLSNFDASFSVIDLSSNNFYGPISNVPSSLLTLDLSKNSLYGGINFLCQIVDGHLAYLDLSHNSFSGQLPNCLWHFKELKVLNLGHNNLSSRIPASVESLIGLEVLCLYNNSFSGEFPLSLKKCTKLKFLDLGKNKFSGNLPVWIGEHLLGLYVLSLRSNDFFGPIPSQLCLLVNLQILDLSLNCLNGTIPSCVNNLTAFVQEAKAILPKQNLHHYSFPDISIRYGFDFFNGEYVDRVMINWQGIIREFSNNLGFLKSIDLSSNNLTGKIPYELTDLHELLALNLSRNFLLGKIPQKIGDMKKLLILDLSRNNFLGGIPSSMSQMTSLNYLDVSYNNLSGRIPSSTQLQSFEPSRYNGNARLCGLPITKNCPGDEVLEVPPVVGESQDDGDDELRRWFYIGGGTGFASGFMIVCSGLLLNRSARDDFFQFLESFKDWVYVKVVVFISKI